MDESGPTVSIIVPVYSGELTLPDLIQRCLALRQQSAGLYAQLLHELIFVCDDPIDNSEAVLRAESNQHDWIRVVSLARNCGQHMATAVGMLYSSGDWILTIDEDLQHSPEILPVILRNVLQQGLDILYVKSRSSVHSKSFYRDFTSVASKWLMRTLTREDYSIVSSFRLLRGVIGRAIAISIDSQSYLDAALFAATGLRRRGVYSTILKDSRMSGRSGYNFKSLLRHFSRLILSAEPSGFRLLAWGLLLVSGLTLSGLGLLVLRALLAGTTYTLAPGWLSLFLLGISIHLFMLGYFVYALKMLSVLLARSAGAPAFLVISRAADKIHLIVLEKIIDAEKTLPTPLQS